MRSKLATVALIAMFVIASLPVPSGGATAGSAPDAPSAAAVLDLPGTIEPVAAAGIAGPNGIVTGPDGNVWFVNYLGGSIGRITPAGVVTRFEDPAFDGASDIAVGPDGNLWASGPSITRITTDGVVTAFPAPAHGVTGGPDGNVWFTSGGLDTIGRITPDGVITTFSDPGIGSPTFITTGPDGNLWFINDTDSQNWFGPAAIGRITPAGVVSRFPLQEFEQATDITAGPDGNVWFAAHGDIGQITPEGTITHFTHPGINSTFSITLGPDGNLWFGNEGTESMGRITPAGVVTIFQNPTMKGGPARVVGGPDGNLWFTTMRGIARLTVAGAAAGSFTTDISGPRGLVTGPDGNVWFTNSFNDTIGRTTPAGVTTRFASATIGGPQDIAAGADGNLWFTNYRAKSIGRVTPAGVVTAYPTLASPSAIAAGPDGNVWFTMEGQVGRITPTGDIAMFGVPSGMAWDVTAGPDGNIWYAGGSSVGHLTPGGQPGASFPTGQLSAATTITTGPDGNLWYGGSSSGTITRVTPAGVTAAFPTNTGSVEHLVAGPDGSVWYHSSYAIGRITTTGRPTQFQDRSTTYPGGITVGPDGLLWYGSTWRNSINRVVSTGPPGTLNGTAMDSNRVPLPDVTVRVRTSECGDPVATTTTDARGRYLLELPAGAAYRVQFSRTGSVARYSDDANSWAAAPLVAVSASAGTNHVDTTLLTTQLPERPVCVTATAGNRSARVTWSVLANSGQVPASFTVTANPGGAACSAGASSTSCIVPGLTNDVAHTFTVTATNAFGTSPTSSPTAPVTPVDFTDVPPGAPFAADINWLASHGITEGHPDGTFRPSDSITRQAMAAFVYRFNGRPAGDRPTCSGEPFTDVPVDAPFCGEIAWLKAEGITTGYPDGSFHPTESISRQAIAAFLYRRAGRPDGDHPTCSTTPFIDVGIDAPFCGEITWMKNQSVTNGFEDGTFRPGADVSRQAMAAFLHRIPT